MATKITIHRALAELKLISSRIDKAIVEFVPSGLIQGPVKDDALVNGATKKLDFEERVKAQYQSILDLIARKDSIKSQIVASNSITQVIVAGVPMTVSDAITAKGTIVVRKALLESIVRRHTSIRATMEKKNVEVDSMSVELAKTALGKPDVKIGADDYNQVAGPFLTAKKFSIVDPIDAEKTIEKLTLEIGSFEAEVDAVLSESNAVTFIEI